MRNRDHLSPHRLEIVAVVKTLWNFLIVLGQESPIKIWFLFNPLEGIAATLIQTAATNFLTSPAL